MSQFEHKPFYRRNLPHIQPANATVFVTFHLEGALPKHVIQRYREERSRLEKNRYVDGKDKELQWKRDWFRKFEKTLDTAESGPVWLKDHRVAEMVAESLHYRDGKVYRLDAYCIMATHVHVVFAPLERTGPKNEAQTNSLCYNTLSAIMQSLKGYTARRANALLGRRGQFWQHESYDHVVRNPDEWRRIVRYVLNNPVKAGLVDVSEKWQWNYCRFEYS